MSTRDVSDNIKELYGVEVSAEAVSNVTNRALIEINKWQAPPPTEISLCGDFYGRHDFK
jgi:transposase-like protein